MSRRAFAVLACLIVLAFVTGCAKKAPQTPTSPPPAVEPAPAPAPAPTAPAPPPAPEPDPTEDDLLSGDLVRAEQEARRRGLLGDVFFDFDRSDLGDEARERLAANARFLLDHPGLLVTIEGHCDERGTNEYNLALGDRRAHGVRQYLTSLSVPGDRLEVVSFGEERPFCTESHEACWSQNRRARFVLSGRRP